MVFVWKGIRKNFIFYYSSAFTINPQPRRRSVRSFPLRLVLLSLLIYYFWNLLSRIPYSVSVFGFKIPRFSAAGLNCTSQADLKMKTELNDRSENSTATIACLYSKDSDLENKVNST